MLKDFEEEYLRWKDSVEKRIESLEKGGATIIPKPEVKSYQDKLESVQKAGFLEVGKYDIKKILKVGELPNGRPTYLVVFQDENSRLFEPYTLGVEHWYLQELQGFLFDFSYPTLLSDLENDPNFLSRSDFRHPILNESMGTLPKEEPKPIVTNQSSIRGVNVWGGFGHWHDENADWSFNYNQERLFLKELPYRNFRPFYAKDVAPYLVPHHNELLAEKGEYVKEMAYVDQTWVFDKSAAKGLYEQFVKAKVNYATFLCYNEGCMTTMRDEFIKYIETENKDFQYYFTISFDQNRKDVMDYVAGKMKTKWYKTVNGKPALECFTDGNDFQKGIDVKRILKDNYGIEVYLIANENIGLSNIQRLKGNYDCVTKYYNAHEVGSQRPNMIFDGTIGLKDEWQKCKENGLDYLPIVTLGLDRSARNAKLSSGVTSWYDHDSVFENIPKQIALCEEIAHPELGLRYSHCDENSEQTLSLMNKLRADGTIDNRMVDLLAKY